MASVFLGVGQLDDAARESDRALEILNALPDGRNLPNPYVTAGRVYSDRADSLSVAEGPAWRKKALDMLRRGKRITAALSEKYRQEDQAHGKPFHPVDLSVLYENLGYVALKTGTSTNRRPRSRRAATGACPEYVHQSRQRARREERSTRRRGHHDRGHDPAPRRRPDRNQADQTLRCDRAEHLRVGANRQFLSFGYKLPSGAKPVMRGFGAAHSVARSATSDGGRGARPHRGNARGRQTIDESQAQGRYSR